MSLCRKNMFKLAAFCKAVLQELKERKKVQEKHDKYINL